MKNSEWEAMVRKDARQRADRSFGSWSPLAKALVIAPAIIVVFVVVSKIATVVWFEPRRQEHALQYCTANPTERCRAEVLAADAVCVNQQWWAGIRSPWIYSGCMAERLPDWKRLEL